MHFFGPYLYRSAFWATTPEQECERALAHLEQVIQFEGPATIAASCSESIVGTAGVLIPPPGYLAGVRALCDKYGIVYIADEVMCGFGRAGRWFAFEDHGVVPDLIAFAKGSNSGYVPVGGVIISDPIAATFDERVFPGGLTYSGHPLACASIVATIDAMKDEDIVENAVRIGEHVLGPGLRELAERHPVIGEVRGTARLLGARPGVEPGDAGDAGAVRRRVRGHDHPGGRVQGARACCRSRTTTGCTWCRRAPSPSPRPRKAWPSWTRRWPRSDGSTRASTDHG